MQTVDWTNGGKEYKEDVHALYKAIQAAERVKDHAKHFVGLVDDLLREYKESTGEYGVIASNYDTELFGHWWFEGVDWLKEVLRGLYDLEDVDLTTASAWVSGVGSRRMASVSPSASRVLSSEKASEVGSSSSSKTWPSPA